MRRLGRNLPSLVAAVTILVACGARSELVLPEPSMDAGVDATFHDAKADATDEEELDAPSECDTGTYCDPADPVHVYHCGQPLLACGSLEQCTEREGGAVCVNPCVDSLGNDTSNGCDFWAVETDTTPEATGVCYAVFVVNQWKTGEAAKIQVSRGGQVLPVAQFARIPVGTGTAITYAPFDAPAGLPANEVAILFLSRDPSHAGDPNPQSNDPALLADCPAGVTPAIVGDAAIHGSGVGSAFHIQTNVPVVAYQMLPYGGGRARVTGSTLLLPTSAWGTDYLVADAYAPPLLALLPSERAGPTTVVIASEDETTVTLRPTADIQPGTGVPGAPAGSPASYTLNAGQYLQLTQRAELTGSAVQASKPVAVIGGATLMDVPVTTVRADTAEQMIPPVRALGSEYVAVRYRNRITGTEEVVPWRVVAAVDGTQLSFDPPQPGAPSALNAQQLAEFDSSGPFVVRSQDSSHPFYMAAYMTGGCGTSAVSEDGGAVGCPNTDGPGEGFGDPEFLDVVPPAQYLPRYTFFTDPTYPETNLVVVRVGDAQTGQMPDVTLDCAGLLGGWQPVGSAGIYEMTRTDLSTGDFQGVGACNNGVHTITASLPGATGNPPPTPLIGVTIWGWGNDQTWPTDDGYMDEIDPRFTRWVSYGYPAGANFKPLNDALLPAR